MCIRCTFNRVAQWMAAYTAPQLRKDRDHPSWHPPITDHRVFSQLYFALCLWLESSTYTYEPTISPHLSFHNYFPIYLIRPASSAERNPLIRTMLSLAPGNILRGTYWSYHILNLVKGDSTHISSLFKAEVMPHEKSHNTSKSSKWSIIYYVNNI